jgi:hypothetical protein
MWGINFEHIIAVALLGLIPAYIADKKGHDFFKWWLFGTLLLVVALPAVLFIRPRYGSPWYMR